MIGDRRMNCGGILSGDKIIEELGKGIIIEPFNVNHIHNNGYDLTLSPTLKVHNELIIDTSKEHQYLTFNIPESGYTIEPDILYLGTTNEYIESRKYVPKLAGKSSIARCGVSVFLDSNAGDYGYQGSFVLEITNHNKIPVIIYPEMLICRIEFYTIIGPLHNPKKSMYNNPKH